MPSLLGERGAGDAFAPPLRHEIADEIADEIAPSSPRRGWLSLTLNGMADTQPSGRCHVCFRPGVGHPNTNPNLNLNPNPDPNPNPNPTLN